MPLSCGETCKMASRLHYDIANTLVLLIVNWGGALMEVWLEIFKRRNENLPYRIYHFESGRKFSFLSFKISFDIACFSCLSRRQAEGETYESGCS